MLWMLCMIVLNQLVYYALYLFSYVLYLFIYYSSLTWVHILQLLKQLP